ncbi:serine hydrolase domain-containing protein [Acinetobacter rudis]|uniref:Class A beta-lactamase-related serine hydrolase n=1 Tax=Acinetobacter chengduensis TaxID=2420890 RepID=A0ABX9TY56_9GAMM|nr:MULTISPECIES: serine hydrolase domain-containing protein [Acinetobacter]MDQ8951533.1 serine hydrolase domain-containing protein [Acinetobacter rudis]RKG42711.1 class A beta-lactamase-related serine hydrolase [Acinetobacter sp. WCHAc060007]RLL22791.1 class A beta-lactamase-related serine hydrolase [Acinetobacter chengduensis]
MKQQLQQILDPILDQVVNSIHPVAGVVAGVTNRDETLYLNHAGERDISTHTAMTDDSVFAIFSTTKAITTTVALQQYEKGLLDLDAPAKEYIPEIGQLQVLHGFDTQGKPILQAPKIDVTTRMLLLHTAGMGYDFFNPEYQKLTSEHGYPSVITSSKASLKTPLLFEPGTQWEYGSNIDWAGLVTEKVGGKRLGQLMQEQIFNPLEMNDTAFTLTSSMLERRASMHHRQADGSLIADPDFILPQEPEVHMGGHGLYSTVCDYLKFIRLWLNRGEVNGHRLLQESTLELALNNGLADIAMKNLPGSIPTLSNDVNIYPEAEKGWTLGFMVNEQVTDSGRPAGTIGWCGLANLYYWIDIKNNIGGYWATQTLPFVDPTAYNGFLSFEKAVNSLTH